MMAFSAMTAAAQTPGQIQTSAMSDVPFAASLEATGLVRGETRQSVVPPMKAGYAEGVTLWANPIYARSWGEMEQYFGMKSYTYANGKITAKQLHHDMYQWANGSGAYYDGKFHMVSRSYTYLYCEYLVDGWELLSNEIHDTKFLGLVATDCDYDPATGLTYGCFWNPTLRTYEFASVDYETQTHTTIAPMEEFSGIAIDGSGRIYGVKTSDGGLYTIDKKTGEQKLVGLTGVKPHALQSMAFDRKTGILYWAVRAPESVSYLATVNVNTGGVRRLAYLPDNVQLSCLYVPYVADEGAPAPAKDVTLSGAGTALTVGFTMPSETADGAALAADGLTYSVAVNGEQKESAAAAPGAKISLDIVADDGYNAVVVTVSNAAGQSAPVDRRRWFGADVPSEIPALRASVADDADHTVSLSWDAPLNGIHGGLLDQSALSYDVVRMPEELTVASDLRATSFTDVLGVGRVGKVFYVVTPRCGDNRGESITSEILLAGGAYGLPYFEGFDNKAAFESYHVVDVNADKQTWFWNSKLAQAEYLRNYAAPRKADDWLLTPEMYYKAGRAYCLSYDSRSDDSRNPETMGIAVGQGTDVAAYAEVLAPETVPNEEMQNRRLYFTVPADGFYRVGFHVTSAATASALLVDNISITDGPAVAAPGMVTDVVMTADAAGHPVAELSFKTPASTVGGVTLTSISKIEIRRNDELIATLTDVAPGSKQTYTDRAAVNGTNRYSIAAFNGADGGAPAIVEGFVGQDIPYEPENVRIVDNGDHYTLTWDAPGSVGTHKLPVLVDEMTYTVSYGYHYTPIASDVKGTSYTITGDMVTGPQDMIGFHVAGATPAGSGRVGDSNPLFVGKPYSLPFRESFARGMAPDSYWWVGGGNVFKLTDLKSFDNDGGCVYMRTNNTQLDNWFNTGKLRLSEAAKPVVSFAYYATPGSSFRIEVCVTPVGGDDIVVGTIDFSKLTGEPGWRTALFDLSAGKSQDYSFVKFHTTHAVGGTEVFLDRITVRDSQGCNLHAGSLTALSTIYPGQTIPVSAEVENFGSVAVGGKVAFYADGNEFARIDCPTIDPDGSATVVAEYTRPDGMTDPVEITAEIICDNDQLASDNTFDGLTVTPMESRLPVVSDLYAEADASGDGVALSWNDPNSKDGLVVESFETYLHKDTSFGEWTTYDGDRGLTYANQIVDIGHGNEEASFWVFNIDGASVTMTDREAYTPHSGDNMLLAMSSEDITIKVGDSNDDWLISPELTTGEAHSLSLWANSIRGNTYGHEKFEIYVTKGFPNDLKAFELIATYEVPQGWTNYTAELPEGTRFFAIRYCSCNLYLFALDDIEFDRGDFSPKGFNVYSDGVRIASLDASARNYSVAGADAFNHTYNITVIYDNGESPMSNNAFIGMGAGLVDISDILADGPADIYNLQGICVRRAATSVDGLPAGVYLTRGRKFLIP